jgi:hypothetical protein
MVSGAAAYNIILPSHGLPSNWAARFVIGREIMKNQMWWGAGIFVLLMIAFVGIYIFAVTLFPNINPEAIFSLLVAFVGIIGTLAGIFITTIVQNKNYELDRHNQMRLAALDKRLQAHQEAYSLWHKLFSHLHDDQSIRDVVMECQSWWIDNCLYLEPNARSAFQRAYFKAMGYNALYNAHSDAELIRLENADIMAAGPIIVEGAALPSLSEMESKRIEIKKITN